MYNRTVKKKSTSCFISKKNSIDFQGSVQQDSKKKKHVIFYFKKNSGGTQNQKIDKKLNSNINSVKVVL